MTNEKKTSILDWAPTITGGIQMLGSLFGKSQKKRQEELNEVNEASNKRMANYEQELRMNYRDTDLESRLAAARKAGVSRTAILGGGMAPTGSGASVSSAPGATASDEASMSNAGTNKAIAAANLALMGAQTKNIEADTKQKEAGAENLGADTTKKTTETANNRLDGEMKKIDLLTKGLTQSTTIEQIKTNLTETEAKITKLNAEGLIGQNEAQYLQQSFKTRIAQTIQNVAKTSGEIELSKSQARYLTEQIAVEYKKLDFAKMSLDQQKQIVADTLDSMIEGKWIDAGSRIVGDLINLIPSVKGIFGKVENMVTTTETDNYNKDGEHTGSKRTTTNSTKPARRN